MTSTVFETVEYEVRDRKAYLTLNRPERLTANTHHLAPAIRSASDHAHDHRREHAPALPRPTGSARLWWSR